MMVTKLISIHASAKEATPEGRQKTFYFDFNPRLREGGDPTSSCISLSDNISIHASAKEATKTCGVKPKEFKFQSTPPRRRRLTTMAKEDPVNVISIHASAKEATIFPVCTEMCIEISIHASAKEATATYCDTSAIMYISSLNNFFVRYF